MSEGGRQRNGSDKKEGGSQRGLDGRSDHEGNRQREMKGVLSERGKGSAHVLKERHQLPFG